MFKAVVFDAYGTLFDVYSIGSLAETMYPGHGAQIATLWRDKQIEYTRLITMSDPNETGGSRYYQDFWELTRAALQYSLLRFDLPLAPSAEEALMAQYAKLTAFAEVAPVLAQLRERGIKAAILSNGNTQMLQSAVTSAGLTDLLDEVISIDTIRLFKTAPKSYGLVLDAFPVEKREVLFVSSNAWDVLGATWFGFSTLWINRQNLPQEKIGPPPHYVGSDLSMVMRVIAP
jgi:2-haloacid dehalogenase